MIKHTLVGALSLLAVSSTFADDNAPDIQVQDNRVSANFDSRPWDDVLVALAARTGIKLIFNNANGTVDHKPITAHFDNVPLDQALKVLLSHYNYTVAYANDVPGRIAELRVSTAGENIERVYPAKSVTTENINASHTTSNSSVAEWQNKALHASDAKTRLQALSKLEKHGKDKDLQSTVVQTLHDSDARVRRRTMRLIQRGAPVDEQELMGLARTDSDPTLRSLAWEELVERSESHSGASHYLEQAKQDRDVGIQAWAARKLQELADDANAETDNNDAGS